MQARSAVDSVPALYSTLNAQLADYLREQFGVVVRSERLITLRSYLVTSPRPGVPKTLVLADHLSEAERAYLLTHTAAHLLLGHAGRPFATILEARPHARGSDRWREDWRIEQERHADALTAALLWGSESDARDVLTRYAGLPPDASYFHVALSLANTLSRLLFGHRHRFWQPALAFAASRRAVRGALRVARALYHCSGARRALSRGAVVSDLREVYCLTELVAMGPEGQQAGRRGSRQGRVDIGGTSWVDIADAPPWHGSAGVDRSLRN